MKKSNIIVTVILIIISIFLLWVWYLLGFNRIDSPLDLLLSILWWIMMVIVVVSISKIESERKRRIRTMYLAEDVLFNSETGSTSFENPIQLVDVIEEIIDDLKYNFDKEDMPNKNAFPVKAILRTTKYKDDDEWEGEVVDVDTKLETPFTDKEELFKILNELPIYSDPNQALPVTTEELTDAMASISEPAPA